VRQHGLSRSSVLQGLKYPLGHRYNLSVAKLGMEAKGILFGPITVEGMAYNVLYDFFRDD
jgi:hypothetical protein